MILFDIFNRHFAFFGYTFYSHDAPLLFFVLIIVILLIFIVTAIFGRLWCGWSCPQTVFIHSLFDKFEKLYFGTYTNRQLFYKSPDSFKKKTKILVYYSIFLALCWVLAHSFVAYFLGAELVTQFIFEGPSVHFEAFVILMAMTLILFFNFAFFREKFCFFICPYGKFQNSLIDRNTLTVFYDLMRGEPRGKLSSNLSVSSKQNLKKGDCVDCNRCVRVCPTKIDIRQGFQSECISCGKCIDACNDVMKKIGKPTNLIRYETGNQKKITLMRFRLALYLVLIVFFAGGLLWALTHRNAIDFNITRAHLQPFSHRIEGGPSENLKMLNEPHSKGSQNLPQLKNIIQNQIQLHLKNQTEDRIRVHLMLSEKNQRDGFRLVTPALELTLEKGQDVKVPAFIEIEENQFSNAKSIVELILETQNQTDSIEQITEQDKIVSKSNVASKIVQQIKTIKFIRVD